VEYVGKTGVPSGSIVEFSVVWTRLSARTCTH